MSDAERAGEWKFYRFGMIVTGEGEKQFLPSFMRSLTTAGNCTFEVMRRVGQRSAISSKKRTLQMVGTGKTIPDRDAGEIGFPARAFLGKHPDSFVFVVDDLEHERRPEHQQIFERYRTIFDTILPPEFRHRASVHFFVNMIEAYYFAHAEAVNTVLATSLQNFDGDVETIRHPKGDLKRLVSGFEEIVHGEQIVQNLDLEKVLDNPETCASLRTLFKWCSRAKGQADSDRFRLLNGKCSPVTESQIESLRESPGESLASDGGS